ncbi:MAG: hypothetical protein MUD08_10220 [Cytophagales bacterium]|jgi:hypothetical protein|nr:hypothetical protein [Cytophagales bacterium]
MKQLIQPRTGVLAGMVLLAALSRLLPHPDNFTPVGAMALFGGAYFANRWAAVAVPLLSMWFSDLVLNNVFYRAYNPSFAWFTPGGYWIYGSILLTVVLGWLMLRKVTVMRVAAASLSASVLFFVVTNFGVWLGGDMYPQTFEGFTACYVAALPFFRNAALGDLVYCAVMFGVFALAQRRFPVLSSMSA